MEGLYPKNYYVITAAKLKELRNNKQDPCPLSIPINLVHDEIVQRQQERHKQSKSELAVILLQHIFFF